MEHLDKELVGKGVVRSSGAPMRGIWLRPQKGNSILHSADKPTELTLRVGSCMKKAEEPHSKMIWRDVIEEDGLNRRLGFVKRNA